MTKKHKLSEVIEFGEALIRTQDLDPVYVALVGAKLPEKQLYRLLLAYFCFYHLGAAAALSEFEGDHFWDLMENAAANEVPPNINGEWPGERWPRGSERRHFRGNKCVAAVKQLKSTNLWGSGTFARECPEGLIGTLIDGYGPPPIMLGEVMARIQDWPMFGPWIAFKAADIAERVLGANISFPNDILTFYAEPRAALDLMEGRPEEAAKKLLLNFQNTSAPPLNAKRRRHCNIQEVESVCCKWKSSLSGHYYIGKDIQEVRHALKGWGKTASRLLQSMPVEVQRGLFA